MTGVQTCALPIYRMNSDSTGAGISKNDSYMNESLGLENILFVGSEIGKGFREGYARCLLDNFIDGIIIFDENGKIQAFNPIAELVFSYTSDEAQMEQINTLIPKLSPATYIQFVENGNGKDKIQGLEFSKKVTGICKNGFATSLNLLVNKIDINGCYLFMAIIRKI